MTEWIVEVDSDDNFIGKIDREIAHDNNNLRLHREVMTLLYTDSTHAKFLLQHRSMKKKQLPGCWTLSVTGHVDYSDISEIDETGYITAATRETKEEIGVIIKNLKLVGVRTQKIAENWSIMGIVVGEYDGEFKLDPEEVSQVKSFTKTTIHEVSDKLTPGARECLEYLKILDKEE